MATYNQVLSGNVGVYSMTIAWHEAQPILAKELAFWLGELLPSQGGKNYWKNYVLNFLSIPQMREYLSVEAGDLLSLDVAALIRVAIANCDELSANQLISDDVKPNLRLLQNARNGLSHLPARGITAREELKLLEPGLRLLQVMERDDRVIEEFEDLLDRVRLKASEERSNVKPAEENKLFEKNTAATSSQRSNNNEKLSLTEPDKKFPSTVKSFIGLDFGTSTSVVSLIRIGTNEKLVIDSLSLDQPQENGGMTRHHLVNTVLANVDGKILFGRDAHRLRPFLRNGIEVFSSFKMLLGIDLGPNYPQTSLRRSDAEEPIESAKDATTLFFKRLKTAITAALIREGQPTDWAIAVTVPASFEANQRRDLKDCLTAAELSGFVGFIDEPNAAFLSHLFETSLKGEGLGIDIKTRPFTVCVYDIGAGTCDVSILDIVEENGFPVSRNRAISRFTALGGDDLDRLIARNVLLPQLKKAYPDFDPAEGDIEQRIIPRLMPTAEMLKIAATNRLRDAGGLTIDDCQDDGPIIGQPITQFSERDRNGKKFLLELTRPFISLADFAKAIGPMLSASVATENIKHVYAPVANALSKANLKPRDIDAVLFIGGTALNPLIRQTIMSRFPETTNAIVPRDLQKHVSMGAAIHAYALDQRGIDMIAPITPEAIYVLTRGGELEPIIRAGTVVPMKEPSTRLMIIDRDGQAVVELPICVGSEDKMLGILRIESDRLDGFPRGSEVTVQARVNHDKILEVTAVVDGKRARCELLNPLSNEEQGKTDQSLLEARQAFNRALLEHNGRPPAEIVHVYALAAIDAREYPLAADLFQKLERLDPSRDHSVYISYSYARADMHQLASEWKIRALERNPNDVAALYNRSLDLASPEAIGMLRRAISISPNFLPAKIRLSTLLIEKKDPEGLSTRKQIIDQMSRALANHDLDADECLSLAGLARGEGDASLAQRASARATTLGSRKPVGISTANLVDSLVPKAQLRSS